MKCSKISSLLEHMSRMDEGEDNERGAVLTICIALLVRRLIYGECWAHLAKFVTSMRALAVRRELFPEPF